jgi:type II secretory pathway component GspD/PulD (secretin)
MPTQRNCGTTRLAVAAALALVPVMVSPGALAQSAGTAEGVSGTAEGAGGLIQPTGPVAATVARARGLYVAGRLVEAKSVLADLLKSPDLQSADPKDKGDALSLLKSIDQRLQTADRFDVSLQKAQLALQNGDIRQAERHVQAVLAQRGVSPAQRATAQALQTSIQQRKDDLGPLVKTSLEQAVAEFEAGRYGAAKASLVTVSRSGVELTPDETRTMERYQLRIDDLERAQGRPFEAEAGLAMVQPGTVRRTDEPAPKPAQPAEQPKPGAQPPTAPAPAAGQPSQDDVIQAAMRAEAQRLYTQADEDFRETRFNSAIEKYTLLLGAYRQYLSAEQATQAQSQLAEAKVRMNQPALREGEIKNQQLVRQRAKAEYDNQMEQAQAALAAGDTGRARDLSARARLTISSARNVFNEQENTDFVAKIEDLNRNIEKKEREIQQRETERITRDLASRATEAERIRMNEKDRRINESIDRVRALQQEQKYAEALQVVDQILFLDPRNPSGLLLRDVLQDIEMYEDYWTIQRNKQYGHVKQRLDNERATVPPLSMMEYPNDWPAKSFTRGEQSAFAESPEDRRVLAELDSRKIDVNFNNNSFADVVAFVQSISQLNLDVDWDSLGAIGIQKDAPVTLHLSTPVAVRVVLDRVLQKISTDQFSRAGWAVNNGILLVASEESLRKNTTLVLYDITDLLLDIQNYTQVPEIDLQGLLQQSQSVGGGRSPFKDDQQSAKEKDRPTRQEKIDKIREILQTNVDPEGWTDNGGETGAIQELNGSLIIRNTPRSHREISGLLSKLREIRSMQINVETKFLLVNQNWFEQIGFDVDLVLNANNNQVRAARAVDPTFQPSDFFNFNSPGPGGSRGLQRSASSGGRSNNGTAAPTFTSVGVVNPRPWSPLGAFQDSLGLTNSLVEGDFATAIVGASPALGISGQFLDDIQVDFLIQATQADKRTVQLTAPRLTFTNGQTANIFVVTQQAFVSDLMPVVGDSAVGFDPTVAVASEGVTMLCEGVISSDRRYVTLNIDAGVGRIDGFAQQPVTAVAGGQLVNSADTQSFIQLPTITVTRVRTTVTVPDEGTVLLGGQRLITELEIETGVPVLSKIPIINRFFTNRIESKEEQTLLILVKPTVLIQAEQEEKSFPGLQDQLQTGLR